MSQQKHSPLVARWGAATDRGAVRRHNEDALLAAPPFFLVADGMGGHDAGDVAAAMVVDSFAEYVEQTSVSELDVRTAILRAREAIVEFFRPSGMSGGSTLTGVAVSAIGDEPALVVVNIGDSRTYRLSGGRLEQLSKDHSTVQELIDAGTILPEDARTHPQRNVITRAISPTADSVADVWSIPATVGDRFLACSDGLTGELTDDEIHAILSGCADPQAAASQLVAGALAARGRDNITAVVVDVLQVTRPVAAGAESDLQGPAALADRLGASEIDELEDTIPTRRR